MNHPRVTVGVILFTGCEKYLPYSLKSLLAQDYPEIQFLFRDQSPDGQVIGWLEKEMPELFKKATVEKGENRMHSGGHNALIQKMEGDYYICASNDMWYPVDTVRKAVTAMEKEENQRFGSATVKLMQWDFEKAAKGDLAGSQTGRIDSLGIGIRKTHHFYDIGQGETDHDLNTPLFGPSGAFGIYRKKALEEIAWHSPDGRIEFFDELLHYKNDVDLAYRLQWAGWPCLFIQGATVFHDRQVSGKEGLIKSRKERQVWTKGNSFFGHLVTLRKNFSPDYSWRVRLETGLYNCMKLIFIVFFEPYLLRQYKAVKLNRKIIDAKRAALKRKVLPRDLETLMP